MLDVVDRSDVVAIFVKSIAPSKINHGARFVGCMDLVDLHLPRADPRKRKIVVAE